jgi:hypothetical protein
MLNSVRLPAMLAEISCIFSSYQVYNATVTLR